VYYESVSLLLLAMEILYPLYSYRDQDVCPFVVSSFDAEVAMFALTMGEHMQSVEKILVLPWMLSVCGPCNGLR
jgi:hypothetical protein